MNSELFEGKNIRFGAFDPERDAEAFSKWTHDTEYMRSIQFEPARPLSPFQIKKQLEEWQKEEHEKLFFFVIRTRTDDRAIGEARIYWVQWNHGTAMGQLGIGSPDDRDKGYDGEALDMLLQYVFEEMNLHHFAINTVENNTARQQLLECHGFQCEVRRRQAIFRDGRYWDGLIYGILVEEWSARRSGLHE